MRSERGRPRLVCSGLDNPSLALATTLQDYAIEVADGARQLLAGDAAPVDREPQVIGMLVRNLRRINEVLDDVQWLSQGHEDGPGCRFVPLQAVLETVSAESKHIVAARGVALNIRRPLPDVPVDARRLSFTLMTLVCNTTAASSAHAREAEISLGARTNDGRTICFVTVSGDQQARMLRDERQPAAPSGLPLVLHIASEILRDIGGTLRHESRAGIGTTFYISLPARCSGTPNTDSLISY